MLVLSRLAPASRGEPGQAGVSQSKPGRVGTSRGKPDKLDWSIPALLSQWRRQDLRFGGGAMALTPPPLFPPLPSLTTFAFTVTNERLEVETTNLTRG